MTFPARLPRGVPEDGCDFFTENFTPAWCGVETETIRAVRQLVLPSDGVLEVGSRYGTTSCEVAVMQNNSGNLVAVEPDHRVWAAAEVSSVSEVLEREGTVSLTGIRYMYIIYWNSNVKRYNW